MPDLIGISVKGADKVAASFRHSANLVDLETLKITRMYTQLLTTSVRSHASGRPGPRTPTGDYRRSITGEVRRVSGVAVGTVGTTRPQGRRLELGFTGVDALGRYYNQPPFPHFRPALSQIEGAYTAAIGGIVRHL